MYSPSSKRPYNVDNNSARERRSKSPARRAQPSPEKRNQRNPRGESGVMTFRKPNVGPPEFAVTPARNPSGGPGRRR